MTRVRATLVNGATGVQVGGLAVAAAWLLVHSPPSASLSGQLAMAVLAGLSALSLFVALPEGSAVGFAFGSFLLGFNVIGWSVKTPGGVLTLIELGVSISLLGFAFRRDSLVRVARRRDPLFLVGVVPWVPAVASSIIAGALLQAAHRAVLLAAATGFLAAARRVDARRLAWGAIAGVQAVFVALLVSAAFHPLANTVFGVGRFGGGSAVLVHPNILGMAAWTGGVAWLSLPGVGWPARIPGVITCGVLVFLTDSRTSAGAGLIAAAVVLASLQRRREWASQIARVLTVAIVVGGIVGGAYFLQEGYFDRQRSASVGTLSGRTAIWKRVSADFSQAPVSAKVLGTTLGGAGAGVEVGGTQGIQTVDDAYLGLLRRAGVIGLAFGLWGWILVIRAGLASLGTRELATAAALIAGALATTPVESWFFGGSLWIWLIVAIRLVEDSDASRRRLS